MGVTASKLGKISTGLNGVKRLAGPALTQTPKGYIPVSVVVNNETKTPKGYIPVSVGVNNETKRFMVRVTALRDADFMELLCRSAEEYGFNNEGILRIPYEAEAFEEMMRIKGSKQNVLRVRPT